MTLTVICEPDITPRIAKAMATLIAEGWRIRHKGSCLLVAGPGRETPSGTYVSLHSIHDVTDVELYIREAHAASHPVPVTRRTT